MDETLDKLYEQLDDLYHQADMAKQSRLEAAFLQQLRWEAASRALADRLAERQYYWERLGSKDEDRDR